MLVVVGERARTRGFLRGAIGLAALVAIGALALLPSNAVGRATERADVLILSTSVIGGSGSLEQVEAESLGLSVEVATPDDWAAKTESDFAAYKTIVIGDPACGTTDAFSAAVRNVSTWSPAITGNVIVIGTDPVFHNGSHPGAKTLVQKGIGFAADATGHTGAYLDLSCAYDSAPADTPVPLLPGLG